MTSKARVKEKKRERQVAKENEMESLLLKYNWTKSKNEAFDQQGRRIESWYLNFLTPKGEKTLYKTLTQAYKMQYKLDKQRS